MLRVGRERDLDEDGSTEGPEREGPSVCSRSGGIAFRELCPVLASGYGRLSMDTGWRPAPPAAGAG